MVEIYFMKLDDMPYTFIHFIFKDDGKYCNTHLYMIILEPFRWETNFRFVECILIVNKWLLNFNLNFILKMWERVKSNGTGKGDGDVSI